MYIKREDAIKAVAKLQKYDLDERNRLRIYAPWHKPKRIFVETEAIYKTIYTLPSADAVQDWIIGKPTEQGKYMVTIDSFGHKRIDLFYYGKPMTPNRKVRGMCWYRSDDEWGDVVYDDKKILAWQPLPTPYKESEVRE